MKTGRASILAGAILCCGSFATAIEVEGPKDFRDPTAYAFGDLFGISGAVDGDRILIGGGEDPDNAPSGGHAYIFDAVSGDVLQTFADPTPTNHDEFGTSVAWDGDSVLIGARKDNTKGFRVGQAHLFSATTGGLLHTFDDPTPTDRDNFGYSVAIDGGLALVGDPFDDTHDVNHGKAHLFDAATGAFLRTFDDPNLSGVNQFSYSVALDDGKALIGARFTQIDDVSVGQAHLFSATTGELLQTFDDPSPEDSGWLGYSVALDGNRALIGAPLNGTSGQAHLFDVTTGNLLHTFEHPDQYSRDFGSSVMLYGRFALIGAPRNGGAAYLFDSNTGGLLHTFSDPNPPQDLFERFGISVALGGNKVLIGQVPIAVSGLMRNTAYLYTIVPEPTSISLSLATLLGFALLRRARTSCRCNMSAALY